MQVPRINSIRTWILAVLVAAAVLVPLYGNPFTAPVTHAEWARMLVRALDMEAALPARAQASLAFSLLSWKSSLTFGPDQYAAAEGVQLDSGRGRRALVAAETGGEVSYRLAILRSGDYHLRLRAVGDPSAPIATEIAAVPETGAPLHRFPPAVPGRVSTWVDVGATHLDRGQYTANLALPPGAALERLEIGPPCLSPIEPPGGWRVTEPTTPTDIAVTAIEALNVESQLPLADEPVEITGSQFVVTSGSAGVTSPAAALGPEATWLKAGGQGLRAVVVVDITVDGLYTLESFGGTGQGQRWLADACHKAIMCPSATDATLPDWREVMTARFSPGRHMLSVTLAPRAVVQRIRLGRKRDTPEDYLAALRRLGFDLGAESPVPRRRAVEAMEFIRDRKRQMLGLDRFCGDTIEVGVPVNVAQGPGAPPVAPPGGPGGPVAPPAVPPPAPPIPPPVPPPDDGSPTTP